MTHRNHMFDTKFRDGVRQNAGGIDVVGNETVGYVAFREERSWCSIENGTFRHAGVARQKQTPELICTAETYCKWNTPATQE